MPMPIKEILMPCDCNVGLPHGASVGLRLAEDLKASITALGLIPLPTNKDIVVPPSAVDRQQRELESTRRRASRTRTYFSELAEISNVPFQWDQMEVTFDQLVDCTKKRARFYDLAIIDQTSDDGSEAWAQVIEGILVEGGRPILLIPGEMSPVEIGYRAIIGWDDSSSASRAVHDAIPLLKRSDTVRIVTVTNDDSSADVQREHAGALAIHLKHHGIASTAHEVAAESLSVDQALLQHSFQAKADLLVIGGNGKSRWGESLLGSLARKLLSDSPIPILISH